MYLSCPPPHQNVMPTILVSLIHHLLATYPAQGPFHQHLDSIPHRVFPKSCEARKWVNTLATSLRSRHYVSLERETRQSTISRVLGQDGQQLDSDSLGALAVFTAVDNLRAKARETAWSVMRVAYRELSCHTESTSTRSWLEQSLLLQSAISESYTITLDNWLGQQNSIGAIRAKEGVEGRWIVCKTRP